MCLCLAKKKRSEPIATTAATTPQMTGQLIGLTGGGVCVGGGVDVSAGSGSAVAAASLTTNEPDKPFILTE